MNTAIEIYQNSKQLLTSIAKEAKRTGGKDKAYIRTAINDAADDIIRQLDFYKLREKISEKQYKQFSNWISATACNLHP